MSVLLHNLDCFSLSRKIQALINELKAQDDPIYDDDIAFLENEFAFAKEMVFIMTAQALIDTDSKLF